MFLTPAYDIAQQALTHAHIVQWQMKPALRNRKLRVLLHLRATSRPMK